MKNGSAETTATSILGLIDHPFPYRSFSFRKIPLYVALKKLPVWAKESSWHSYEKINEIQVKSVNRNLFKALDLATSDHCTVMGMDVANQTDFLKWL